jgi:hypothetical protein
MAMGWVEDAGASWIVAKLNRILFCHRVSDIAWIQTADLWTNAPKDC